MGWGNDNFKYYFKIQAVKPKYINSIKQKTFHKRKPQNKSINYKREDNIQYP